MTNKPHYSPSCIDEAVDNHADAVYRLALNQLRSPSDAHDVVQEVFLRLLTSTTTFTSQDHLRAWLIRVAINVCHDMQKSAWNRRVGAWDTTDAEATHPEPSAEDEALEKLYQHPVWKALEELPEDMRLVVQLRYVEEMDDKRIAEVLGVQPVTVRTRLHRARARLRDLLLHAVPAPEKNAAPREQEKGSPAAHSPPASMTQDASIPC
ncbi:MAG TPA: RNA polymerase sigma factor [Candidatus Limicola stercorigallinarum]|nr:RNA polymerase sigma factor [Candidatus Limicola stercorigallinarum]